ncbi:MAG: winged helix DNA-binding domain-containing protein, partial [Acidimicrobiales bacterium]
LVRTHILRPTWHFVAAEDLRWILALTSGKVESSFSGRRRRLGLDGPMIERALDEISAILDGRRFSTAAEIGQHFASIGHSIPGDAVRHLLLIAELRGLICSGPLRGSTHTYGLVNELIPPTLSLERDTAARQLVQRFFTGHGPASEQDLRRWTTLTLAEIRQALAELDDAGLETLTCEGTTLWFDPASVEFGPPRRRVALLPTFDEAYLPYRSVAVARIDGHPRGDGPHVFAEAGGGVVIADRRDAGWWKRTARGDGPMTIRLGLATGLDTEQRQLITAETAGLAAFFDRDHRVELVDP